MARLFLFAVIAQFIVFNHSCAQSWSKGSVKGEGEVVRKEISLAAFNGVSLGFNGDVILTPGSTQKVVIEGQQNIIDNIQREVEGGKWKINYIKNVQDAKDVKVYITVPRLDYVGLFGSGTIKSDGKFSGLNQLELALSGSGDIIMEADAIETELHISGSGDIAVSGSSKHVEASISGSGDVEAADFVSSGCEVHISGSGDATVHVNGDLEVQISGSGDVMYKGNVSVTASVSGSVSVSKL